MKKIKIGLAGLGALGEMHIANIQRKIPEGEIAAVCDIREERVREIREKYGIPSGYTNYDDMVNDPQVDAILIATNVAAHKEQCIGAARAGKHIFCEKPLAETVEDCHEIERAAEKNPGKIFTIGFMRRADEAYANAMERVRAGEIGDVIMFKSVSLDPAAVLPQHLAGVKQGKYAPFFYEMGIHDADLALWFLGSEMESVYAVGGAFVEKELNQYQDYDNAMAVARMKNGSLAFIQVGRSHNSSHVHSEIVGTKGTIQINQVPNCTRLGFFNENGYVQPCEATFLQRWENAYVREIEEFLRCIRGEKKPELSVYDGAKSLRMADMMHKSYVENRLVFADE